MVGLPIPIASIFSIDPFYLFLSPGRNWRKPRKLFAFLVVFKVRQHRHKMQEPQEPQLRRKLQHRTPKRKPERKRKQESTCNMRFNSKSNREGPKDKRDCGRLHCSSQLWLPQICILSNSKEAKEKRKVAPRGAD